MSKQKGQRRWQGSDFKRARRMVESLYFTRVNEGNVQGPLKQHFRGLIPPTDANAALFQLQRTACLWHCVSISYFQDNWGKKYRRWGFAKTTDHLKIIQQPLDPVLRAAQDEAERNMNIKHLYARSYIIAPWNKQHPDIFPLVKKHANELSLTEEDLEGIKDYLNDDFVTYEYDPTEVDSPEQMNDLDYQISKYL